MKSQKGEIGWICSKGMKGATKVLTIYIKGAININKNSVALVGSDEEGDPGIAIMTKKGGRIYHILN